MNMLEQMPSWEHQLIHDGCMFSFSEYDTDTDIISPKQISILSATDKPFHMIFAIAASSPCKVQLMETVVLGTGGSVSAGTAVTGRNRDRNSSHTSSTTVKKDYVLGSTDQSAGTEIDTYYLPGSAQGSNRIGGAARGAIEWALKPGVLYGLIITAIADNTVLSWCIEGYED